MQAKNKFYSPLALGNIIENELENDNEDILVNTLKAEGNKCPICWKINKDKCERHGHLS